MKKDKENITPEESSNNNCGILLSNIFGIDLNGELFESIELKVEDCIFQGNTFNEVANIELSKKLDFTGQENHFTSQAITQYEHLELFLSEDFFKLHTSKTNKNIIKKGKHCDRIKKSEIKTYIGIRFYMSICKLPCYDMY
ncbi:hypothetical protein CDIK_4227 [Cucumispora dikerogammari]|nr:hypothetical protein CDIK_4227 [Cucumispora dikerogammari]